MKTLGIVGGIAPESTVEYYKQVVASYRAKKDGSYPVLLIYSIDLQLMLVQFKEKRLADVVDRIVDSLERLARAGADVALIASNTPHLLFRDIQARSPLPMISIIEATYAEAQRRGLRRPALFGSRYTMQGRSYADVFDRAGTTVVVPQANEIDYIHTKYMDELINGVLLPETRDGLLAVAEEMRKRDGVDGLILGGTELPLILKEGMIAGFPFLDTTEIHVRAAITEILGETE